MKSKKLFAILTLVAFMMTLVPAMAFGAADRFATVVSADKTSAVADGTSGVTFTVYTYDTSNQIVSGGAVYAASDRGNADAFARYSTSYNAMARVSGDATGDTNDDFIWTSTTNTNTGKYMFKVTSNVVGTAKIGVSLATGAVGTTDLYAYLTGVSTNAVACELVKTFTITFTSPSASTVATSITSPSTGVTGTGVDADNAYTSAAVEGNGLDTYEIQYRLTATNNAPVADQEVTFTTSDPSYVSLNKTSAKTDAAGIVKVKASASKAGTYYVKATVGSVTKTAYVKFATNPVSDVEITSATGTFAKDSFVQIKFKLKDASGNQVSAATAIGQESAAEFGTSANAAVAALGLAGNLVIETLESPDDANIVDTISDNTTAGILTSGYTVQRYSDGTMRLIIGGSEFNKVGDYKIRFSLDNGKYADYAFKIAEQGTPTKLVVYYYESNLALGEQTKTPVISRLDANGVSKLATSDLVFTVDNVTRGTINATTGRFTATTDKDYAGDVTITAVDKANNLVGTAKIAINSTMNGFTLTGPTATTQIGNDAVVAAQFVDVNGKAVAIPTAIGVDYTFHILSKPEGAIITTSAAGTKLDDLKYKGTGTLKVKSDKAGEVKVQVVAKITKTGPVDTYYSKDIALTFGAPKVVVGAKNINMYVGAKGFFADGAAVTCEVAPFVGEGNRAFVELRNLANAMGVTNENIKYEAGVITLTRSDMVLSLTIGSKTITKTVNGVATTITADVAPYVITGANRTVLPLRAVGEAFGYKVDYNTVNQLITIAQ